MDDGFIMWTKLDLLWTGDKWVEKKSCPKCHVPCTKRIINPGKYESVVYDCSGCGDQISGGAILK